MKTVRLFLVVFIFAITTIPARAVTITPTVSGEFVEAAPVLISAYQTYSGSTGLAAVEVYNDSNNLVNLSYCKLFTTTKDLKTNEVNSQTNYSGYLLPNNHVVYGIDNLASYKIAYGGTSPIIGLELRCTNSTGQPYQPAAATIKDQTDTAMFRSYTNTGYSTAAQPFVAMPQRNFYDDGLYVAPAAPGGLSVVEVYPYASSCAPNDNSLLCGDYIKLQNNSRQAIQLDDLAVRTDYYGAARTGSNTILLQGTLLPGETKLVNSQDSGSKLSLANTGGYVWLEDAWGLARYDTTMTKYEGAASSQQGYAYAVDVDGAWQWTTTPQPTGKNLMTKPVVVVAECAEGKYRNPETGRCRTIEEAVNALAACDEGQERNLVTNRCRKVATLAASTLSPCLEGQERNPATNRCRSIAKAVAELLPCDEGYERNPATNRCRKIKSDEVPQVGFPVQPVEKAAADMTGWLAFAAIAALAVGYGGWEWRHEIAGFARKAVGIFTHSK